MRNSAWAHTIRAMSFQLTVYKTLFVALASCYGYAVSAQELSWAAQLGGEQVEYGNSIAIDDMGNTFVTGDFWGTADFDPDPTDTYNLTPFGSGDIFVTKLDPSGDMLWTRQLGGDGWDEASSIALDEGGHVYITGYFLGFADFDPDEDSSFNLSSFTDDIFVCKLTDSGEFVWAKQIGGEGFNFATALVVDQTGDLLLTGGFSGTVDFDPGPGTQEITAQSLSSDAFVVKLNDEGELIWVKTIEGSTFMQSDDIAFGPDGSVYCTGLFWDGVDFDPNPDASFSLSAAGSSDAFVLKSNTLGEFQWARQLGGPGVDTGESIGTDALGNVYTLGSFSLSADFDPDESEEFTLDALSNQDAFVSKLDDTGDFLWAKHIGGLDHTFGWDLEVSSSRVHLAGEFGGTVDFDPGPGDSELMSEGGNDAFVCSLDLLGNFVSVAQIGGLGSEQAFSIAFDDSDNLYATGNFSQTADFDPDPSESFDLTSSGSTDAFVTKLSGPAIGTNGLQVDREIRIFPNPVRGDVFHIDLGRDYGPFEILIKNLAGTVMAKQSFGSLQRIQMTKPPVSGCYVIELRFAEGAPIRSRIICLAN